MRKMSNVILVGEEGYSSFPIFSYVGGQKKNEKKYSFWEGGYWNKNELI